MRDYLVWQAPWLLALQSVTSSVRAWLETEACKNALLVEQLYRTYPDVVDCSVLKAARVEATLRKSAGETGVKDEKTTTTFFVTGN